MSELAYFGPYTSKDIDYFGQRDAAEKLADAIGGKVLVPAFGDNTPESAVVTATIDGHEIKIDFLTHVLGVEDQGLKNTAITMNLTVQTPGGPALLKVPIMHPVQCMQSRIANVTNLKRDSELSKRQLEASPIIVREFISEMLSVGHGKEATRCLSQIFEYLRSDIDGKRAHKIMTNDPAAILDHFQDDERIDERYRAKTLHNMREQLRSRRTAWGRIKAVLAMKSEIAVPELEPGSH